ncbi:hypothetical protein KCU87_g412, partial [Aureobasidium melanogenum]
MLDDFICFFCNLDLYYIFDQLQIICTYGHSQLKTGHPVRSAIHKQLNGRLTAVAKLLYRLLRPVYVFISFEINSVFLA